MQVPTLHPFTLHTVPAARLDELALQHGMSIDQTQHFPLNLIEVRSSDEPVAVVDLHDVQTPSEIVAISPWARDLLFSETQREKLCTFVTYHMRACHLGASLLYEFEILCTDAVDKFRTEAECLLDRRENLQSEIQRVKHRLAEDGIDFDDLDPDAA